MSAPGSSYENCGLDAAPYVLGALTEPEYEAFKLHLESCAVCREEVAALQTVVASLPAAVPQVHAPADLKRRVMATVESEASLRAARDELPRRIRQHRSGFSWRPLLGSIAATAAVTVAAVLAFTPSGSSSTRVIRAQVTVPSASAVVRLKSGHAELQVADMPQSSPGHIYEVWVKKAGLPQPTDALFSVSSEGKATVGVPGSTKGVTAILVTAEPDGGSRVPTTNPVIVANLS